MTQKVLEKCRISRLKDDKKWDKFDINMTHEYQKSAETLVSKMIKNETNLTLTWLKIPEKCRNSGFEDDAIVLDAKGRILGHVFPVGLGGAACQGTQQPDVVGLRV